MLKKLLAIALFSVMLLSLTGCKDNGEEVISTVKPTVPSSDIKNTEVIRVTPPPTAPEIVDDNVEKDFSGIWKMTSTSSENANFESMLVDIGYDGYNVSMTFLDSEMNTSYEGEYEIKDGVLVFDDNFADCTAYFYEGSDDTLVVDNGISQVFCQKVPED